MATDERRLDRSSPDQSSRENPNHEAATDQDREARFAVIDRMREAFADVSTEEIEREVAKAVAEVRAEMEAERRRAAQAE